ncbi:MAG: LLM class flavin-dependent oxidoreductase [Chloroflexi bacterium]|nr:LLM class flavin-dependent oxidoreductase [Chloroflexota bacterium]
MKIGIALPAMLPGVKGADLLDWARRADAGPFSSLAVLDRLVYPNYESLITLAAAAAVTRRIRLITTILIGPLRGAAILAKQAASIDAISAGRLTLGLGIGGRQDDFHAAGVDFHHRGKQFENQLETMKRIWSGEPLTATGVGAIGPRPSREGGPELLIGGYTPAAQARVARWGDGFISGGGSDPAALKQVYAQIEKDWRDAGRSGKPRFVGAVYCVAGEEATAEGQAFLRNYYSFMGTRADAMAKAMLVSPDAIREAAQAYAEIGMDELILWPCSSRPDQIDRLADLVQ